MATDDRWTCPDILTPALVVDLEACERNIAAMARSAAAAGTDDLFVAYPLWAVGDIGERAAALAHRVRLSVGADSVEAVRLLAATIGPEAHVTVLVEVDCGLRRSGVAPADAATVAVAARDAGLAVGGVFTFPGHRYAPGASASARHDEGWALSAAAAALESAGIECPVRSGGSTPTAAGTLGTCALDDVALAALATVVSAPVPGRLVLDAGAKVLGPERPPWTPGHGLVCGHPDAVVTGLWEHHAVVDVSAVPPAERPHLGDQVAVVPNHVWTAVNLARVLHVVSGGQVAESWDVAAAGANR